MKYFVIDFEVNSLEDLEPIECAIILKGISRDERFSCKNPLSPDSQAIHHIRSRELEGQPLFQDSNSFSLIKKLIDDGYYLIAHGISFELKVLEKYGISVPKEQLVCTQAVAKDVFSGKENQPTSYKLQYLRYYLQLEEFFGQEINGQPHRAFTDVAITSILVNYLKNEINKEDFLEEFNRITKESMLPKNHVLWFGKYYGKTLGQIYEENPQYIDWLADTSDNEDLAKVLIEFYDYLENGKSEG